MCFILGVILLIIAAVPALSILRDIFGAETLDAFFHLAQQLGAVVAILIVVLLVASLFKRR
jgi:hypothetical protein